MADLSMNDKASFTFRLDLVAFEKSKIIAKRECRSSNGQLEYFVLKGIALYEEENGIVELNKE